MSTLTLELVQAFDSAVLLQTSCADLMRMRDRLRALKGQTSWLSMPPVPYLYTNAIHQCFQSRSQLPVAYHIANYPPLSLALSTQGAKVPQHLAQTIAKRSTTTSWPLVPLTSASHANTRPSLAHLRSTSQPTLQSPTSWNGTTSSQDRPAHHMSTASTGAPSSSLQTIHLHRLRSACTHRAAASGARSVSVSVSAISTQRALTLPGKSARSCLVC